MITFESGSGSQSAVTKVYRFRATERFWPVACFISEEALGELVRDRVHPLWPMALFRKNERIVFNFGRQLFALRGRNLNGMLTITTADVAGLRLQR